MPDPDFQTLSSSQIPDLLNIGTWGTRFTLHTHFARRIHEDRKQNVRMKIGKLFEALILELTAEKLALEVRHNLAAVYVRHPTLPLGCTEDANVLCPTRGVGVVEAKAVDKYEWARSWTDTSAPKIYEAQLQEQMMVKEAAWGIIACLIYNEGADGKLMLYERRPNEKAYARIAGEATAFFADLAAGKAPPAFGLPIELPLLSELHPEADPMQVLDATDNYDMTEFVRLYAWTAEQATSFKRAEAEMKPKLLDFTKGNGVANLAEGVVLRVKKPQMSGQVVMLPAPLRNGLRKCIERLGEPMDLLTVGTIAELITQACEWAHVVRQPGVQNRVTIREGEKVVVGEPDDIEPLMNIEA